MCIHMYTCVYVYIHMQIICAYKDTYLHVEIYVCRHTHTYILVCSNMYKHMYWCIMKYNIFQIEFWIQFVCSVLFSVFP